MLSSRCFVLWWSWWWWAREIPSFTVSSPGLGGFGDASFWVFRGPKARLACLWQRVWRASSPSPLAMRLPAHLRPSVPRFRCYETPFRLLPVPTQAFPAFRPRARCRDTISRREFAASCPTGRISRDIRASASALSCLRRDNWLTLSGGQVHGHILEMRAHWGAAESVR